VSACVRSPPGDKWRSIKTGVADRGQAGAPGDGGRLTVTWGVAIEKPER
jgi:hypothetical protein